MWFERFWQLIDHSPIGVAVEKRRRLLEYTGDPARIYVENVRSFFGVSHGLAKTMCELAVRQGLFDRCSVLLCPHDERVLFETCSEDDGPPDEIACSICEAMEIEPSVFSPNDCRSMPFYRLHESHAD